MFTPGDVVECICDCIPPYDEPGIPAIKKGTICRVSGLGVFIKYPWIHALSFHGYWDHLKNMLPGYDRNHFRKIETADDEFIQMITQKELV